ncbi:hypothetical protein BH11ACT3_BH11ACT3_01250 [soil metagenome]
MALGLRVRESAATLTSIALVMFVVTLFSGGTTIYLDAQGTRGVQTGLQERSGSDVALRASLSLADNPERQDQQVRTAITNSFAGTGVDFAVTRTLSSHVTVAAVSADPDAELEGRGGLATSIPDFSDRAQLVDGALPTTSTDVAVQADAAKALGLVTGQDVLVAGVRFTVSGTWRPIDISDPRWYGDVMVATGFNDDYGPFVITEDAWSRIDENPEAAWTLIPDTAEIDSGNAAAIIDAWGGIKEDWRATVPSVQTLTIQNRLVVTLRELEQRLDGLGAVEPVVFSLLAAIGLIVMAELVRLLVVTRRRQAELYWARGDSTRAIALRSARDVAVACVVGLVAGLLLAIGAIIVTGRDLAVVRPSISLVATPLTVLVGAVVVAVVANRGIGGADFSRIVRQRRRRRAAVPGIVVLVVLAAGVSVWQLRLYGTPLTPTADGAGGVDPLAVVAPAAALVAVVLIVLALFPTIASTYERGLRRGSLTQHLAARGLVRRLAVVSAPLVVVALAIGTAATAAGYSATWNSAFSETAALRVGSDLHANERIDGFTAEAQDAAAKVSGVTAITPLEVQPLSVGGQSGSIVAASPDGIAEVANLVPGKFDPKAAADAIRYAVPGPVVPAGTESLTLTVDGQGFAVPPTISLWLANPMGLLRSYSLTLSSEQGADPTQQVFVYEAEKWDPPLAGPWRIAALDFTFGDQDFALAPANLHLRELRVTGGAAADLQLDGAWVADGIGSQAVPPSSDASRPGLYLSDETLAARLTPSLTDAIEDRPILPILISQQLADRFSVAVGDSFGFGVQDGIERLNCRVVGIIAAIPGAPLETALMVDLAAIQHYQLRTTAAPAAPRDLLISTPAAERTIADLRDVLPASTRIDSREDRVGRQVLGSAADVLWAAAVAAILLAIIGVSSSVRARLRTGRNDLGVLRALGLTGRDQAAIITGEFAIVVVTGAIAGLIAGVVVCVLTIPYFARAAVTFPYFAIPTDLRFDFVGLVILLAILAVALAATLIAVRRTVAAVARRAMPSEESA